MRDKSRNVAWLAIASFGESWHNLHHAEPDEDRLTAKRPATATRKLGSMTRRAIGSPSQNGRVPGVASAEPQ